MTKDLVCAGPQFLLHPSAAHQAACPLCNPTKTVPELNQAYADRTSKTDLYHAAETFFNMVCFRWPGAVEQIEDVAGPLREALKVRPVETAGITCPMAGCPNRVIDSHGNIVRPEEPTRELTLHDFGYAPGNYTFKCHDCGQDTVGDKRALRCKTCAAQALRENRRGAEKTPDLTGGEEEYRARMCLHPEFLSHPDGEICVSCGKTRVELKATELPLCDCDPDFGCKERDR
jgi:hypothetical protein